MRLILLGPPGSGKGTQAALLMERYGIPAISTGEMFRAALSDGSEVGNKAREYMESGRLVPDEIVLGIVRARLEKPDTREGFILDGFPRTVVQGRSFENVLESLKVAVNAVLFFDVPEEAILHRITGRRTCMDCGRIFNVSLHSDDWEGSRCPFSGERCKLMQRSDDREDVVIERLHVYRSETAPLVDFYEQRGMLVRISGTGTVQQVFERIVKAL